jgi:hypothetical protein
MNYPKFLNLHRQANKPSIVGGNNALGERRLGFISLSVIDLLLG